METKPPGWVAVWLAAVLVLLCAHPAVAGARALKAMWGPSSERGVSQMPVYRDLGIELFETRIDWAAVAAVRPVHPRNPRDPAYRWPATVSGQLDAGLRNGTPSAVELIDAPGWANGGHPPSWAPRRPSDFADFAFAAARRYPGVRLWMVWGEPTRHASYQPTIRSDPGRPLTPAQAVSPHRYAQMLDATYGALKRASRRNLVIGGMTFTTGDVATRQWIENLRLPSGRPPRLDLYGHNPFSGRDPDLAAPASPRGQVDFSDLRRLAGWIDRYLGRGRPPIKLFLSEWTIPTAVDDEFNFFVDPLVAARWITDGLHIARTWSRVYALGWINLYDDLPRTGGGLLDAQGNRKPGYFAWKNG